jgi:hypothetical protein
VSRELRRPAARIAALVVALAAALAPISACRRGASAGAPPRQAAAAVPPKGDAIWLSDPAAPGEPGLDDRLHRLGASALFLPAGTLDFEGGTWSFSAAAPPREPARVPVVLVAAAGPALGPALQSKEGLAADAAAKALAAGLAPAIAASGPFGRVAGVHLDFPFGPESAKSDAALVDAFRRAVGTSVFVSITLARTPANDDETKAARTLSAGADALLGFVFGRGGGVDPAALDALGRPWWAGYAVSGSGEKRSASGEPLGRVSERWLDPLSGNPRIDFENDLSLADETTVAFHFTARAPVRLDGLDLAAGDRVAWKGPAESELIFQLGSALTARHRALGRVLVFGGASEAERMFPIAAFEDVLLGRALAPALEVSTQAAGRAVIVEAVNRTPHASSVSRVANWVEVDVAPAHPSDVQVGGFERYEVYDAAGRPVTPGRGTRVRLYEALVAPAETITAARIVVRGALPSPCCPHRAHVVAAAGTESAGEWIAPPKPTPAPTKPPKASGRMR